MSILFAFPGQGAQKPGMLHRLPDAPEVADALAEAGAVLGEDALALDSAEALRSTRAVQLCLLVAGVAVPALLPDGSIAPESLSEIIDATPVRDIEQYDPDAHALTGRPADGSRSVSGSENMSGKQDGQ